MVQEPTWKDPPGSLGLEGPRWEGQTGIALGCRSGPALVNHQKYKPSSPEIYIALCLLCGPLSRASVALRRKGFFPLTQSVSLSELGLQVFLLSFHSSDKYLLSAPRYCLNPSLINHQVQAFNPGSVNHGHTRQSWSRSHDCGLPRSKSLTFKLSL